MTTSAIQTPLSKRIYRTRRRSSLSLSALSSLWIVSILPYIRPYASLFGTATADIVSHTSKRYQNTATDTNINNIQRRLRGDVTRIQRTGTQQQRQLSKNQPMTENESQSLNDDDAIEAFMEGKEDVTDDNVSASNSTDDDMNSLWDEMIDEIFDTSTSNNNSSTTTTVDEALDDVLDAIFDSNGNTTNSTIGDAVDEFMNSIFGFNANDILPSHNNVEPESTIEQSESSLLDQEPKNTTTSFRGKNISPSPPNLTDGSTHTGMKKNDNDDASEPKAPIVESRSPTVAPHDEVTSTPTESPSMERIDDFDEVDKKTEMDDDRVFDATTYPSRHPMNFTNNSSVTTVLGILAAITGMIFTAWQMSDNPDGIYASLCRLTLTCLQLVFRIILSPCRKFLPCCGYRNHHLSGTNGYHEPYGHLPVSTMDYGYKDPTLELT
jgi:hypothetical protein